MPDIATWITALRSSHDRLTGLLEPLDDHAVAGPSYAAEWSIAEVASHLGSQAEIFGLFLDAGLSGGPAPGGEQFGPIWDRWNARTPREQVTDSLAANEGLVARFEGLTPEQRAGFELAVFGTDLDLAGLAAMRLGEHAVHTWDVAVALDPAATVSGDAVELLLGTLPATAGRAGQASEPGFEIVIETASPQRGFTLSTAPEVVLAERPAGADAEDAAGLSVPAEALVRLVYGRLDPAHTPSEISGDDRLDRLRPVFPGF